MQDALSDDRSSEEAFAGRLRTLEVDAWAELYDRHHRQLWRYTYARTGRRDLADELVQQVFAEAVGSIRRYHATGKPVLAWLYAIARNQTWKILRRSRREAAMSAALSVSPLDDHLESLALQNALELLPDAQREALVLRFFAGYSADEVGRALGKTPAAVYSLQARALEAMRRALEPQKFASWATNSPPRRV